MTPIRVLIVDDHQIVREGLHTLFAEEADFEVAGSASDGFTAIALAQETHPDVVLIDLVMPGMDGIEAIRHILKDDPRPRILVLTSFAGDDRVLEAIQAGATGYLLKDVLKADLLRALRDVASGRTALHPEVQEQLMRHVVETANEAGASSSHHEPLTKREEEVLRLIAKGNSNKEIASALSLTEGTVKGYVSVIFDKLGVADRTQAALYAVKHGLG